MGKKNVKHAYTGGDAFFSIIGPGKRNVKFIIISSVLQSFFFLKKNTHTHTERKIEPALEGVRVNPSPFKNLGNKKKRKRKHNVILIRRINNVQNISIVKQLPLKSAVFALMVICRFRSQIVQLFSDLLYIFSLICKNCHGNPAQSHCCMMFSLHGSRKYTYHRNYISYSREHRSSSRIRSNH